MEPKLKATYLVIAFLISILTISACKKDKLEVIQEMRYSEVNFVPKSQFDGGWGLILEPDGGAGVLPRGDIMYEGTYKIDGSRILVKSRAGSFIFQIISKTQIKEKEFGTILELK